MELSRLLEAVKQESFAFRRERVKTAFLVVDVQNDFLPGGALPVKEGDVVISLINQLIVSSFTTVVASKDWHPQGHGSFANTHGKEVGDHVILKGLDQVLWPVHCVQGTWGAEFAPGLNTTKFDAIFYKGTDVEIDSYSAFFDNGHCKSTGLTHFLKDRGVSDVYVAGLATDYCVKYTVLDALKAGFHTYLVVDACRAVNVCAGDGERAIEEMKQAGARIVETGNLVGSS